VSRRPALAAVLAVAVMTLSGACGSAPDGARRIDARGEAAPAAAAPNAPAPATPAPLVATVAPAAAARSVATSPADVAAAAPPGAAEPSAPVPAGEVEVVATAAPTCVAAGEVVAITIRTRSGSTIGFAATFADSAGHGAMGFGEASGDGTFVWHLAVPPDAPPGDARALVGVETAGDRRTGRTVVPFLVAGPGGCR
jgi:hypothetical protein